MLTAISAQRDAIADACRRFDVSALAVFGSAATDEFDDRSDVDLLVSFDQDSALGRYDAYFGLKEELEQLFGRPVDLVDPSALDNPYFARSVEATRHDLYAA